VVRVRHYNPAKRVYPDKTKRYGWVLDKPDYYSSRRTLDIYFRTHVWAFWWSRKHD